MRVAITIYVEGGGNPPLNRACVSAFKKLFEKAGFRGSMPKVVPCEGRGDALKAFKIALGQAGPNDFPILLVDSEQVVRPEHRGKPWDHLAAIVGPDRLARPDGATDDHAHLMVQCMESWFLVDRDWLARYFGQPFQPGSLPGGNDVEPIEKRRVIDGLRDATRQCRKGRYEKGRHSFEILAGLDPAAVEKASFHCQRLFSTLRGKVTPGGGAS